MTTPQAINAIPTPVPETVTKKIKVFSPETLQPAESTYSYTFTDAGSITEAERRLASLDQAVVAKRLLLAMNGVLNFFAARDARANAVGNGIPTKAFFRAISGLRSVSPFSDMITAEPKTAEYKAQRKAQSDALREMIQGNIPLKNMIVNGIKKNEDEDEDGEGDDE